MGEVVLLSDWICNPSGRTRCTCPRMLSFAMRTLGAMVGAGVADEGREPELDEASPGVM